MGERAAGPRLGGGGGRRTRRGGRLRSLGSGGRTSQRVVESRDHEDAAWIYSPQRRALQRKRGADGVLRSHQGTERRFVAGADVRARRSVISAAILHAHDAL